MNVFTLKDFIFLPVNTTQLKPVLLFSADIPDATILQVPVDLLAHIVISNSNESTSPVIIISSPTFANSTTTSSLVAHVHGTLDWNAAASTGKHFNTRNSISPNTANLVIAGRQPF